MGLDDQRRIERELFAEALTVGFAALTAEERAEEAREAALWDATLADGAEVSDVVRMLLGL